MLRQDWNRKGLRHRGLFDGICSGMLPVALMVSRFIDINTSTIYLCLVDWQISFILFCACVVTGIHYGTGRHYWDITEDDIQEALKVCSDPPQNLGGSS